MKSDHEMIADVQNTIKRPDYICPWSKGAEIYVLPPLIEIEDAKGDMQRIARRVMAASNSICLLRESPASEDEAIVYSAQGALSLMKTIIDMNVTQEQDRDANMQTLATIGHGHVCTEMNVLHGEKIDMITAQSPHYAIGHARRFPHLALAVTDKDIITSVLKHQQVLVQEVLARANAGAGHEYSTSHFFVRANGQDKSPLSGGIPRQKQSV
jgi:hypothetical protein